MGTTVETCEASGTAARSEIVDDEAGLDALESTWRAFERSPAVTSPCMRWDWMRLWWQHYGRRCDRLWVVVVRLDDVIVGLCPLYLRDAHRPWGRRLRFLATGEPEQCEVASEFLDVLAASEHRAIVADAAVAAIASTRCWREVELRNVLDSADIARAWDAAGPRIRRRAPRGLRYTLDLGESWEAYLARLAPRFRSRVRAGERAFSEGRLSLVETTPGNRSTAFDLMVELHQRRWHDRGRPGAFASPVFREFHRRLLDLWSPAREALLRMLCAGNDAVGVLYNFRWQRLEAYYQSGFATGHDRVTSPGLACHVGAIRQARAEALSHYDFMLGKPQSYKAAYGCETRDVGDLVCDRRGPMRRALDRGIEHIGLG